jgi:SMC interacting uncharacterized protein involved in chromosome segregation
MRELTFMSKEDLQKTLERLRAEVSSLHEDAGPVKDRVNSLITDLEHQLQDLDNAGHRATMRNRVATLIEEVEAEHPAITGMLEQIMTALTSIGI